MAHPKLTPEKLAEIQRLRETIDRDEKDEIIEKAKKVFARHDRIRATLDALQAARQAKQMSLDDLAIESGIDKANLSRFFNAPNANPTLDTLLRVADAVGVRVLPLAS